MSDEKIKQLVRIMNTDIDGSKSIGISLRNIHGISHGLSNAICHIADIDKNKKSGTVTQEEIKKIEDIIVNPLKYKIPGWMLNRRKDPDSGEDMHLIGATLDLRKDFDIKMLKKIKAYRGVRHAMGQPTRGQRTRAHFRHGKSLGVQRSKILPQKSEKKKE